MTDSSLTSDERYALGCMSGTSLDGLDVATVRLSGRGRGLSAEVIDHLGIPFDEALREQLQRLASDKPARPSEIAMLARRLGNLHADLCEEAVGRIEASMRGELAFVAVHGQTIAHHPGSVAGPDWGTTWQLIDPFPTAERLRVRVCTDLRGADVAAGGEGAPITPAADPILFPLDRAVVVNLGGIVNATRWSARDAEPPGLPWPAVEGGDVGPCNLLLDPLAEALLGGVRYDVDGAVAASGQIDDRLVDWIVVMIDTAMRGGNTSASRRPRSLGREQFGQAFIESTLEEAGRLELAPADVLASAVDAVARRIAEWVGGTCTTDVVLAGGGVRNLALVARLVARLSEARVRVSSELGLLPEAREAAAMAVLGAMALDGLPITIPSITGAARLTPAGRWTLPALRGDLR